MQPEEKLKAMGLELPEAVAPRADIRTPRFTPQEQVDTIMELGVPVEDRRMLNEWVDAWLVPIDDVQELILVHW